MNTSPGPRWEAVGFDRDESLWGFVLRDDEGHIHVYERTAPDGTARLVAPSFTRLDHAQLFVDAWPERPVLARGPSYDLGSLEAFVDARPYDPETAEYAWAFVLDVLDAVGDSDELPMPETSLPPADAVREGLVRVRRAILQLDR